MTYCCDKVIFGFIKDDNLHFIRQFHRPSLSIGTSIHFMSVEGGKDTAEGILRPSKSNFLSIISKETVMKRFFIILFFVLVALTFSTTGFCYLKGDINNDDKIGLSEAAYALQVTVGSVIEYYQCSRGCPDDPAGDRRRQAATISS
jgi:hypothetical protein